MNQRPSLTTHALALLALVTVPLNARAEAPPAPATVRENNGFSFGMDVQRMQDDFGVGARVGSPFFLRGSSRLTLAGGVSWFPHGVSASGDAQWITYGHARLVMEGGRRIEGAPIRLYGFGGVQLLVLPDRLSSKVVAPGGVGGFGFELYMPRGGTDGPVSYFIELGGVGTGANADHVLGRPIFANGFLSVVGLRGYL